MINRMIKLLKFSGLLLLIFWAFILQVSAQPQNPPPPDDPVPFTGLEYLLVSGGALGIYKLFKKRGKAE
jgi:hypothetical protein